MSRWALSDLLRLICNILMLSLVSTMLSILSCEVSVCSDIDMLRGVDGPVEIWAGADAAVAWSKCC